MAQISGLPEIVAENSECIQCGKSPVEYGGFHSWGVAICSSCARKGANALAFMLGDALADGVRPFSQTVFAEAALERFQTRFYRAFAMAMEREQEKEMEAADADN